MELIKDTTFEVAWHVWQAKPPQSSLTVAVKGTFTLVPEGTCPIADAQALPEGDAHHDDDVERSLRYASDLDPLKARGECMVIGSFHAPGGRPVTQSTAAFQIGGVGKQLASFGDRAWHMGRASEPTSITTLPLSWEHAFGGPGFAENPVGRGIASVEVDGHSRVLLPNIEDPRALVTSRDRRPHPVGCGPIPRTWAARMRYAGTYDATWQRTRYPWFPADLEWRFFNAAPPDQQIDGHWRGDEEIALRNLHREHASIRCRLPGLRAHAFLVHHGSARLVDVGLALDTITVDADEGQVYCVWRGVTEVARADLSDVQHLFVAHEAPSERHGIEGFTRRYQDALERSAAEALAAEAAPTPASSGALRFEAAALLDPSAPGAKWAHLDQANTVRGDDSALQNALKSALAAKAGGALRPVFEDALHLEAPPSVERELSPEELLDLEVQLALGDVKPTEDPLRDQVRAALAAGESLAGRDLSGADLSNLQLVEVDLRGAILVRANLSGARLEKVRLEGASLGEAELSYASFSDCSLALADLTSARARDVRMYECDLTDATMAVAFARGGRFARCRFVRATMTESDLGEADFRGCTLDGADLSASILESASFGECTLVDAWLEGGVKARGVRMDGCDCSLLRGSEGGDFEEASFKKATLLGARFGNARMRGAIFNLANLQRADFSGALLVEASLMGCDLRAARFDGASLVKASLLRANLMQARFEEANLRHADLRGANLYQAELWQAKLEDARLDLADLAGTRIG